MRDHGERKPERFHEGVKRRGTLREHEVETEFDSIHTKIYYFANDEISHIFGLEHSIILLFLYLSVTEWSLWAKGWVRRLYFKCQHECKYFLKNYIINFMILKLFRNPVWIIKQSKLENFLMYFFCVCFIYSIHSKST